MRPCSYSLLLTLFVGTALHAAEDPIADCRALLFRGRYAEAVDAAKVLEEAHPIDAKLLHAEALADSGHWDDALKLVVPLFESETQNAAVARTLALFSDRYRPSYDGGKLGMERLLELNPDDLVGRRLQTKQLLARRKFDEAKTALAWFAEHREKLKPSSAEEALALAGGLADHAAWSRESKWFDVAVNEVLGAAEKRFPLDWRIPAERARLFAEKHNEPAAVDSLNAALAKNGVAAELHALRARFAIDKFDLAGARRSVEQAKRVNKLVAEIYYVDADIAFAELRPDKALEILGQAQNNLSIGGIEGEGRELAARVAMQRKTSPDPGTGARNREPDPHCFIHQGDALDRMRRFGQAAEAYRQALQQLPEYPGILARLAQQLLRLGEEEEGAKLLAEARKEDPFDVRVKNTLAVLDVLSTYATLETDHFILRFDRGRDELLARYVAAYLEDDVYPDLVKRFGYEPRGKSLIEIYNRSRNTSGHGWFSARMVGVPGLHTIGACAGKIVALASPTDMPKPFHWARVLRHEFVHLLNLEQTAFNVPHWVTEGLAVAAEDRPRPGNWTRLITQRYQDDELFTLDDINFGFIRPSNSDDWTCAYAQAEIYIEFLSKTYGDQAVPKLLTAFAENLATQEAIERASGVKVEEFEHGYREYVGELVKSWGLQNSTASQNIDRLKAKLADEPENAELLAALAAAHLGKGELPLAKKYATQAAKVDPKQPTAAFVLASLTRQLDPAAATRIAQAALEPQSPHEGLLLLLIDLKLADRQHALAEKLLLLGKKRFPSLDQWNLRLAKLYDRQKDNAKLEPVLLELAQTQEDDASLTSKLLQLASQRRDATAVQRWAQATLQIDVRNAAAHAALGEVLTASGRPEAALREWEAAVEFDDKQPEWQLELAKLLLKSGNRDRAKAILERLVEKSPGLPGLVEAAQELRK